MKNKTALILILVFCIAATYIVKAQPGKFLNAGEIMPQGWMKEQIRLDLEEGYLPHFDKVNHTVTHDLFVNMDRKSQVSYDGLRCWWSGEHEGYWKDGVLRMAFLSGNEAQKARAISWIDEIVAAQDEDGYIGVYDDCEEANCRYKHTGENGELWAQSRIFQALIAAYEFTENDKYFKALERAVNCTMVNLRGNYFDPEEKASGGVSHAVGFFDALWYLYNETGDQQYADYSIKLYEDFNNAPVRDNDLQTQKLLSDDKFDKHGAHIAEGFFIPAYIASITDDEQYDIAAKRAIEKLKYHLTPGGAMVCHENVKGNAGSGDQQYEYCGIAELVQALTKMLAITGDAETAEITESMTLNAGQGARFPVLTALSYLTSDNRIDAVPESKHQRNTFAAFHRAAACCTLNGGRLLPYYIEGMWIKQENGLTAHLYGPCTVNTKVNGVEIFINEDTNYPFEDEIKFTVNPEIPVSFNLRFRIPEDAEVKVSGIKGSVKKDGYLIIDRKWETGDSFTLKFDHPVKMLKEVAGSKETYLKRGPLVYALPIEYNKVISTLTANPILNDDGSVPQNTINPESGFHVYEITATDSVGWNYSLPVNSSFKFIKKGGDKLHPYADTPVKLKGKMLDSSGKTKNINLVPLGSTILRRTTFKTSLK